MTRDDVADLHFSSVKNSITQANMTLKRMGRDGYIDANTELQKYVYFPIPSIKKDSQKIPHYLAILKFYRELNKHETPRNFNIEPRYGKGFMQPDIFMVWKCTPFFAEIQRKRYNEKEIKTKMKLYESYFYSDEWKELPWQPDNKKVFPRVWMITDYTYDVNAPFKLIQTKTVNEFLDKYIK